MSSFRDFKNVINTTVKVIHDSEKFPVGILAVKARKVAEIFPNDPTSVGMVNFLTKRADKSLFISRAELKQVYNRLYSSNNKFAESFSKELGLIEAAPIRKMVRDPNEGKDFTQELNKLADPILSNALSQVFDKKGTFKPYSNEVGEKAARCCLHELNRMIPPKKIEVVAGQEDLILCKAYWETPKGYSTAIIPVEVRSSTPLIPTVMLTTAGFIDLEPGVLKSHIIETAGKKFAIDTSQVLQTLSNIRNAPVQKLSEVEFIIAKTKAAEGTPSTHTKDGIFYQQIDPEVIEVKLPKSAQTEEFSQKLSSPTGGAEFKFGKKQTDNAKQILRTALHNMGYRTVKVSVADFDNESIYLAASVDNISAFKAPMKLENGIFQLPKFVLASGNMFGFNRSGISQMMAGEQTDGRMLAVASPQYGMKPGELLEQVKQAMHRGNLVEAEEAISVLQQSGDKFALAEAFDAFKRGLSGQVTEECHSECAMQRKVAHSKYIICGHTNLPLHKVYQDKYGQCLPLYRKNASEPEGGSFLHSKVYWG